MIQSIKLERKVKENLIQSARTSQLSPSAQINESLAHQYGVQSHTQTLEDVAQQFNVFVTQNNKPYAELSQVEVEVASGKTIAIYSDFFDFNNGNIQKKGYFKVTLTDGIASITLRFDSRDIALRNSLENLTLTDPISLYTGSKHTAIGVITREHDQIDKMDTAKVYNILTQIFALVSPYI